MLAKLQYAFQQHTNDTERIFVEIDCYYHLPSSDFHKFRTNSLIGKFAHSYRPHICFDMILDLSGSIPQLSSVQNLCHSIRLVDR